MTTCRFFAIVLVVLSLGLPVIAKERKIQILIPAQGKFPPPWTDSIRVAISEDDEMVQDHRHFKKGDKEFRALLSGALRNKEYVLEILCMGKGGKPMAVFQSKMKLKSDTKSVELRDLKFLETIKK